MQIKPLAHRKAICVTRVRGLTVMGSTKALADMTEAELNGILTSPGRVSQNLVREIYAELDVRKTNSAIESARADHQIRLDIIAALMAEGKSEVVANNLINTEAKMLAQGKRLEII